MNGNRAADLLKTILRDNAEGMLVLRNPDIRKSFARGGDVDCLVSNMALAINTLTKSLGNPLYVLDRSYVYQMFYPWGHIDLCDRILWRNFEYLDAEDVFQKKSLSDNGVYVPSEVHQALICWFASLLWGGFTKERYRSLISGVANREERIFCETLEKKLGRELAVTLTRIAKEKNWEHASALTSLLRRKISRQGGYIGQWVGNIRYFLAEVRLRRMNPVPSIALLGPDGAGKSTILKELSVVTGSAFSRLSIRHWRPGVLPDFGVLFKRRKRNSTPNINPHGSNPHGFFFSLLRVSYYVTDYWLGLLKICDESSRARLIVFDRYAYDMAIDPKRFRFKLPQWLLDYAVRLTPKPDLAFCLDSPVEVLRSRKQEVSESETHRQRRTYREFVSSLPNGHVIDASRPVEEVAIQIRDVVFAHMRSKTSQKHIKLLRRLPIP